MLTIPLTKEEFVAKEGQAKAERIIAKVSSIEEKGAEKEKEEEEEGLNRTVQAETVDSRELESVSPMKKRKRSIEKGESSVERREEESKQEREVEEEGATFSWP